MPPGFLNPNIVPRQRLTPDLAGDNGDNAIVPLEPDFPPDLPQDNSAFADDGRVENRVSRIFRAGRPEPVSLRASEVRSLPSLARRASASHDGLAFFRVDLPAVFKPISAQAEQFISSLLNSLEFASFEMVANETEIFFQFAAPQVQSDVLGRQLRAHLPDLDIRSSPDGLERIDPRENNSIIVPFGLANHWFRPIPIGSDFGADPLIPLVAALEGVRVGEIACVQVMFTRTRYPWQQRSRADLFDAQGKARYANPVDLINGIRQKLVDPLAAVSVRLFVKGADHGASTRLARQIMPYFKQFGDGTSNSLIPVRTSTPAAADTAENILARTSHRSGILLSVPELSSLVRFPSETVRSPKLRRNAKVEKRAPEMTSTGSIMLGRNSYQNEDREVRLSPEQRTRHMHVIGASGSGKTTLLLSLAKSDIDSGDGVCIVDPHGDLIDAVVENVPDRRLKDVVLFDPSDAEFPIGFNILHANSPLEKTILSSDLVATFRRMATSWGDVMDSVLANAVLAFLESTRGGTLFDLRRFLVEKDFREEFLQTVTDDSVRYFWEHEFQLIAGKPQASILIRLDMFLRQSLIRNIVCQKENKLDFRRLMDEKKILLIKLSQGLIGEENAYLLGTMILSRIYQAALSRQDSQERPYCWLSVDEFHHLVTPSLESAISGARKFNLGILLAHQQFKQIQTRSQDVASSVLSNCYTRVCFRLGDADAEKLAGGFSSFDARALQNLGVGEAIARVERADYDFNLSVNAVPRVDRDVAKTRANAIREFSRSTYGRPQSEVEEELRRTRTTAGSPNRNSAAKPTREPQAVERSNDEVATESIREEPIKAANVTQGEHTYLQGVVKRIGEKYGYRATLEQPVLGGVGKVDVALESDATRIAVEIANTNTKEYEVNNIQKCLAAQFDRVVVISTDASHLNEIRTAAQTDLSDAQLLKTSFTEPANIHLLLERIQRQHESPTVTPKVKGYRVETSYADTSPADADLIAQTLSEILEQRDK